MGPGHDHQDVPVAVRVRRLEERAEAAGLATGADLDAMLGRLYEHATPVNGARMAARAWLDAGYRDRLLIDGNAAAAELGFGPPGGLGFRLKVVANAPGLHNLVVCTLCSCYPVALLGPSPSWYKSLAYRSRAVREPREVLEEFGLVLPVETEIRVWDANSERRYLVLPRHPDGTDGMTEDGLAGLVTQRGLIGTAAV
jgi:nitrile hydratase subunit alpha